jgi:hypothetical protein
MPRAQLAAFALVLCCFVNISAQTPPTQITMETVNAMRSGGFPAAAAIVGNYVALDDNDSHGSIQDLYRLATSSDVVVLARVVAKSPSQLSSSLRNITTDHQLTVPERFQGSIDVGAAATVRMRGGKVTFSKGTSAEIRASRMPAGLEPGHDYVFFLTQLQATPAVYETVCGPQGLFAFTSDGSHVISPARDIDDVFKKYNGLTEDDFLAQVRAKTRSLEM